MTLRKSYPNSIFSFLAGVATTVVICASFLLGATGCSSSILSPYQHAETTALVKAVEEAAASIAKDGEKTFPELSKKNRRRQKDETYLFVIDTRGNTFVHPALANRNNLQLKDAQGRPFIKWFIQEVTRFKHKSKGWTHYLWKQPGRLFPSWKSSFIKLVIAPSGQKYIVGCGNHDLKMEKVFVIDTVEEAVALIQEKGPAAFKILRSPTSPFVYKEAYIFVIDKNGTAQVNPAFPNFEGRDMLGYRDAGGKYFMREMFDLLKTQECGWVEYMWPKPGEAIAAKKSTYVKKAKFGPDWFLVGSGVYLTANHGPTAAPPQLTSKELLKLTRCIATTFKKNGEESLPEIKKQCTGLEKNHAYVFILNSAGIKIFDSANPKEIGQKFTNIKDLNNRPVSRWIKEIVTSKSGEGWIHFFWPKPKEFYPIWTTVFAKRARAPNGKIYSIIGGVNNMPAEKRFLMDTANQAAYLVKGKGKAALPEIRAPGSRFTPLGICTFVSSADGTELLNTASPQLEGQNLLNYKDAAGKYPRQELLAVVQTKGNGWINYLWPKPGEATPSKIVVYARQVKHGEETFIVGASAYLENSTPARRKQK